MTGPEIGAVDTDRALAVVPIGAVEQHGPHLPLITDSLVAEAIATRATATLPDDALAYVLPTLSIGKSTEHLGWPGTLSYSTETLLAVCRDVGRSVAASGFRRLVFVNGHGGNPSLLDTVSRDIRVETGLMVFPVSVFRLGLPEGLVVPDEAFSIHGGYVETSVMLELAPDDVHLDRAEAGGHAVLDLYAHTRHLSLEGAVPTAWLSADVTANGVVGDPAGASVEVGRRLVDCWSTRLAEALVEVAAFEFPGESSRGAERAHPVRTGAHLPLG